MLTVAGRLVTVWRADSQLGWAPAEYHHLVQLLFPDDRIDPANIPLRCRPNPWNVKRRSIGWY